MNTFNYGTVRQMVTKGTVAVLLAASCGMVGCAKSAEANSGTNTVTNTATSTPETVKVRSIAKYDAESTYHVNDFVFENGKVYICTKDTDTGAFNEANWKFVESYDATKTYKVNDVICVGVPSEDTKTVNYSVYKCVSAISTAKDFQASDWALFATGTTEVTAESVISDDATIETAKDIEPIKIDATNGADKYVYEDFTSNPTDTPTDVHTDVPTNATVPTEEPTGVPTEAPSDNPTDTPNYEPSDTPSDTPSNTPTPSDSCHVVHHDAVTQQVYVQDSAAYDETVVDKPAYDESVYSVYIYVPHTGESYDTYEAYCASGNIYDYTVKDRTNVVHHDAVTHTVHHDATGHYESVVVTPAYDETVC